MPPPRIALVGDYSAEVPAHRAIPHALELAAAEAKSDATWQWFATRSIRRASRDLASFSAIWLVPASPYENAAGAIDAVRFARETHRPFLGSCGGFQHALIEYARNVAGLPAADHAETHPGADTLLIAPLTCPLVGKTGTIRFTKDSLVQRAYGRDIAREAYHCSYGLNPAHRAALEKAGLRFTAFDEAGEVRAAELPAALHPFFVGTLFQSERAALRNETPPLATAFIRALGKKR